MDWPLTTCAWNRVSVPMCEHHHESQDTRHPIGFGLLWSVLFSLFNFDFGLIYCAVLSCLVLYEILWFGFV